MNRSSVIAMLALLGLAAEASAENDIVLVSNGFGAANSYPSQQLPASFNSWCNGCFPTVQLPLADAKTGVPKGFLYAWGQNVVANPFPVTETSTFCFDEFVIWQLPAGEIHTISTRGPCGTYMNRDLVPPATGMNTTVVAGGGQGDIVGGTGPYARWKGTYATRVFVEDAGVLQFTYYDYLFVSIKGSSNPND